MMFGPNIIGGIRTIDIFANGAFHRYGSWAGSVNGGSGVAVQESEFNAGIYSNLFGNSQTVQPRALQVLTLIKA